MGAGAGECAEVYVVRLCGFATSDGGYSRSLGLIPLEYAEVCAAEHPTFVV